MYTGNTKIIKAYLVDWNTSEKIIFQYNPPEWEDRRSVNYTEIVIPGISHPVYQYVASGERSVNFTIQLNAMYNKNAMYIAHWIRARTYPVRSNISIQNAPHKVVFIWPNAISLLGVITDANRKIEDHFPDGRIKLMSLEVTIKEAIKKSWSFDMVR
ncbi:hypothetical protein [Thermosipho sp. (in: thermotogales)]|jgi:hypothetical protein|uniref:hypothetical protein n=1 Tax=Thermosipho sp. (in: thermotogales) TaxID=1968895 RepID=UPI00257FDCA6|nr:hypothetical protein [Thermosipho sp. (in: thermotogales)]MBZ4649176.1 hypothetical protein [Thermosipho sp. (in: thermotogales)]